MEEFALSSGMSLPGAIPPFPDDPLLRDVWLSQVGIIPIGGAVDIWKSVKKRTPVPAPDSSHRPGYGVDGVSGRGRPCVQYERSAQKRLASVAGLASGVLPLNGARPYIVTIFRYRALDAASTNQGNVSMYSSGTHNVFIRHTTNTVLTGRNPSVANQVTTVGSMGTTMHIAESWSDGSLAHIRVDGTDASTANTNSLPADLTQIALGADNGTTSCADLNQWAVFVYDAKPSDAHIANLRRWATMVYGTA